MKSKILLNKRFTEAHLKRLEDEFSEYQFIHREFSELSDLELSEIEAVLGWGYDYFDRFKTLDEQRLSWIQTFSAGVDSMDFAWLAEQKIVLTNASGVHGVPIRETVFAMLLAISRGLVQSIRQQSEAKWSSDIDSFVLEKKTMMIFGAGSIGQSIAELAVQAFQMKTIGVNRSGRSVPHMTEVLRQFEALDRLAEADIVVGVLPLTDESHQYFNYDFFKLMKTGSIFVNVGRGPSVHTSDLNRALEEGVLTWAALDVTDPEPLPEDHPLWQRENVLITPHISGLRPDYDDHLIEIIIENLRAIRESGRPQRNVIDYERGY